MVRIGGQQNGEGIVILKKSTPSVSLLQPTAPFVLGRANEPVSLFFGVSMAGLDVALVQVSRNCLSKYRIFRFRPCETRSRPPTSACSSRSLQEVCRRSKFVIVGRFPAMTSFELQSGWEPTFCRNIVIFRSHSPIPLTIRSPKSSPTSLDR